MVDSGQHRDTNVCRITRRTREAFVPFMLPLARWVTASVLWLLPPCLLVGRKRHSPKLGPLFLFKPVPDFEINSTPWLGVELLWMLLKNLFCIFYSAYMTSFLLLQEELRVNSWFWGLQGWFSTWCPWQAAEDPSGAIWWVGDQREALVVKAVQAV